MKLSESIQPISYLKAHASEIVRTVTENRDTVIITQNGKAKAVLQDIKQYEETQESLAFLKILAISTGHLKEGNMKRAEEAFAGIDERIKTYNESR